MNPQCPLCGGLKEEACTTFTVDLKETLIVIRDVPATICSTCGSEWFTDEVSDELELKIQDAQRQPSLVNVIPFRHAA